MPTHLLGCACVFSVREVEEYMFSRAELRTIQAIADDVSRAEQN